MTTPAYRIDGAPVDAPAFYAVACDPRRSVVVEACAGAGKTWMLVARILRALLEGAAPQQILAITFTRKAAGEMRGRLDALLHKMALASPQERVAELIACGLDPSTARAAEPQLATLAERLLDGGRAVEIRTFHGWFAQLLRNAPAALLEPLGLSAELTLLEDLAEIEPQLWRRFLQAVATDADLRADHAALVRAHGRSVARDWLRAALTQRSEIERSDAAGRFEVSVPAAADWAPDFAAFGAQPARAAFAEPLRGRLAALAAELGRGNATQQKAAVAVEEALSGVAAGGAEPDAGFAALWGALHTQKDEPRKLWRNAAPPPTFDEVCAALAAVRDAAAQQAAHEEHGRLVRLSRALLGAYRALKREAGLADMADLEACAEALLADAELSGWVQERLDARLRHLLVDEFQDSSPTQWRTLQAWLAGYGGAGGGASGQRPLAVFLVGDPKQSIYRFRRADPRVFGEARGFVQAALDGAHLSCDHTRRNAPAVIEALNAVFGAAQAGGEFDGFRPHTTASVTAGAVWRLPAVPRPDADERAAKRAAAAGGWRDSLVTPRIEVEEALRLVEARRVAAEIERLLAGADGSPPLSPGDIQVLARKRAPLALVAQALRERGIACNAPSAQPLAERPEARDLIALLDVLVSPCHDLSLAQALRSPVFGASDEDLQALALAVRAAPGLSWWDALQQGAGTGHAALDRARVLLPGWAAAARALPPHDLLDRIAAEGDLHARTAAAVPAPQRALALATLDALLAQALALDGGRYATPYGFVRALKRRPLTLPPGAAPQAVQLLTIHGAKGLEAAAVFIVDGLPEPVRAETATLLIDWPADAPAPRRCAFVASEARCPPSLRGLLDEEQRGRAREELNALYVAMTRARQWLAVSATMPHGRPDGPGPWERLQAAGVEGRAAGAAQAPEASTAAAAIDSAASPRPESEAAILLPELPRLTAAPATVSATPATSPDTEATRLGRAVHRVLEWRPAAGYAPEALAQAGSAAALAFGLPADAAPRVAAIAAAVLASPDCRRFFDPAQIAWAGNEVTIVWRGETLRIDRLVALRGAGGEGGAREWWVLDYKLQHAPEEVAAYRAQLVGYREAVAGLRVGEIVRAAFVTGRGEVIGVEG